MKQRRRLVSELVDRASRLHHRAARKRSALEITDTELRLIAAAAIMGESSKPGDLPNCSMSHVWDCNLSAPQFLLKEFGNIVTDFGGWKR